MVTKLDQVRIKNVLDAIRVLEIRAERLEKSEDPHLKSLAKKILSLSEDDVVMELGMELASAEDGHPIG